MVRPFSLSGLARVSGANLDVVRSAAALVGTLDRQMALTVPTFGTITLRCLDISTPSAPEEHDAIWALSRDGDKGHRGYLGMTGMTALRLVAATLGLPGPRAFRPLGTAERGIVTALIATVLRLVERDFGVTLGPRPWQPRGLARLSIQIDFGRFYDRIWLDIPPAWIPTHSAPALAAGLVRRGIDIPVSLELARTILTANDWSRARPGDAVVFDGWLPLGGRDSWPTQVICGAFAARATCDPDGRITINSPFQPHHPGSLTDESGLAPEKWRHDMATDERETSSATVLASAPIQIVAEIGRLQLRADEVNALQPGSILAVGPLRDTTVDLRIGDHPWARGELVDVDGQLGVRLTKVLDANKAPLASEAVTLR